jgi:hypothetical protein
MGLAFSMAMVDIIQIYKENNKENNKKDNKFIYKNKTNEENNKKNGN